MHVHGHHTMRMKRSASLFTMLLIATSLSGCLGGGGSSPSTSITPTSGGTTTTGTTTSTTTSSGTTTTTSGSTTGTTTTTSGSTTGTTTTATGAQHAALLPIDKDAQGNAVVNTAGVKLTSSAAISGSQAQGFNVQADGDSASFASGDCQTISTFVECDKTVGTRNDTLNPNSLTSQNGQQTWVTWGVWETTDASRTANANVVRHVYQGSATPAMPTSGTATYSGTGEMTLLTHDATTNTLTNSTSGNATVNLNADFAQGKVNGTLTGNGINGQVNLQGDISGSDVNYTSVSGTIEGVQVNGTGKGGFFGPNAEATAGVFTATGNNAVAAGSFIACKQGADCK